MNELRHKIRKDGLHSHYYDEGGYIDESRYDVAWHVTNTLKDAHHNISSIDGYSFWAAYSVHSDAGWLDVNLSSAEILQIAEDYLSGNLKLT